VCAEYGGEGEDDMTEFSKLFDEVLLPARAFADKHGETCGIAFLIQKLMETGRVIDAGRMFEEMKKMLTVGLSWKDILLCLSTLVPDGVWSDNLGVMQKV
jgi:hypothetical protein